MCKAGIAIRPGESSVARAAQRSADLCCPLNLAIMLGGTCRPASAAARSLQRAVNCKASPPCSSNQRMARAVDGMLAPAGEHWEAAGAQG